jgi:hypothetical protein
LSEGLGPYFTMSPGYMSSSLIISTLGVIVPAMKIMCPEIMLRTWGSHLNFYKKTEIGIWLTNMVFQNYFGDKIYKNFEHKLGPQKDLEIIYKVNKGNLKI